jgi:arylsulfatase A-like enzyme
VSPILGTVTHARTLLLSRQTPRARARLARAAALIAGFTLIAGGCARHAPPPAPRNILLITIDTLRSDRVGAYGNPRVRTPTLDRLAQEGVLFSDANAQIPSTLPSHASILTGRYPTGHGVHDNGVYSLAPSETTLAEILSEAGFTTGAFVSAFVLDRRFGIDQGFAAFGDRMEDPLHGGVSQVPAEAREKNPVAAWWIDAWYGPYQRRGESTVHEAIAWLDSAAVPNAAPFFLWVHLFDPHEPYAPPAPFTRIHDPSYAGAMDGTGETFHRESEAGRVSERDVGHMRARYDAEVAYTDRCLGELLDALAARGLLSQTLLAVTADHGEGLGEHDYYFEHGSRLWEPLLRIPLVLCGPGVPRGRIVAGRVRSIDITPTLLAPIGIAPPAGIDGLSLWPRIEGDGSEVASYAETQCRQQAMPVAESVRALSSGRWKLLVSSPRDPSDAQTPPRIELFDLSVDAGESRSVVAERKRVADELLAQLVGIVRSEPSDSARGISTQAMDEETIAKLRALGYVQ